MNLFANLRVGAKLMAGFLTVVALTGFLGAFALVKLAAVRRTTVDMAENWLPSVRVLADMRDQASAARRFEYRYILSRTDQQKEESRRSISESLDRFKVYQQKYIPMISSPEEKQLNDGINVAYEQYRKDADELTRLFGEGKQQAGTDLFMTTGLVDFNKFSEAIQKDIDLNNNGADASSKESLQIYGSARILIIAAMSFGVVAGVLIALFIARLISRPVQEAAEVAKRIAAGDLSGEDVKVTSNDEVGQLSADINLMHRNLREVVQNIAETAQNVANASEEFSAVSQHISANSEQTSAQANTVTTATEQVNRGLQTVATSTEEMSVTIKEIAKSATEAAKVADGAMRTAAETNAIVAKLGESSAEIGQVIKVITSIAQKTDLLALNATVEAARAGEAGAGFAVVANEVKELAKQTANATEEISRKIEAIQNDAKSAVSAIASISGVIGQVNDISGTIATAVEEQSATTSEMSRNVAEAARGAGEVAQNIQGVAQAAESTSHGATDSQKAAKNLAEMASHLRELVGRFKLSRDRRVALSQQYERSVVPPAETREQHAELVTR